MDDACLEAACEDNSSVTGEYWCAFMQTCFRTGDQSQCEKAYCEVESGSPPCDSSPFCTGDNRCTGYSWCELTGTCVPPGDDDACLEAVCGENSASTGYHWCVCLDPHLFFPPGDQECDTAHSLRTSVRYWDSNGSSWCDVLEKCLPPSETCALPTVPPAPTTDTPVTTFAPTTAMATFRPTLMPTLSRSSKSSKSRRHTLRN